MRRLILLGVLVALPLVLAVPAHAKFTENDLGCAGSATVTDGDETYEVDAADSTAKLPREGSVHYVGSVDTITHDHFGEVVVHLLGFDISAGDWGPSKNASNSPSYEGDKDIPDEMKMVPPGKYVVSGFHEDGEGARCAGEITIDVQGSPLSSPIGIVSVVGSLASIGGLVLAARGSKLFGVLGGVFLGLFGIFDAIMFKLAASDTTILLALPVVALIGGIGLAMWAPLAKAAAAEVSI